MKPIRMAFMLSLAATLFWGYAENTALAEGKGTGNIDLFSSWRCPNTTSAFNKRAYHTLTPFNGELYLIGGYVDFSTDKTDICMGDVWRGHDGQNWTLMSAVTAFGLRYNHSAVVFNERLWVLGGSTVGANGTYQKNDVWSSSDGVQWTQELVAAPWSAREGFCALVFDGKIWVMGGWRYLTESGETSVVTYDDVWNSTNGIDWTLVTEKAAWAPRYHAGAAVLNGKMYVLGGFTDATQSGGGVFGNDVWYSSNGADWTPAIEAAPWTGRFGFSCIADDSKLWIMGGVGQSTELNDVWTSSDGASWTASTATVSWEARSSAAAAYYKDRIWITGGFGGGSLQADTWYYGEKIPYYTLTVSPSPGGTITTTTDQAGPSLSEGTTVQIQAVPNNRYMFSWWTGDISGSENPTAFIMDSDKTIGAQFTELTSYTVTLLDSLHGTILLSPPQPETGYAQGAVISATAIPDSGYQFYAWTGDLSGSLTPSPLVLNTPKSIGARFIPIGSEGETSWWDEWATCFAQCPAADTLNDADGDWLNACQEGCIGTSDTNADSDDDGMPDGWEARHQLDPTRNDAQEDPDQDGLTNLEEFIGRSQPNNPMSPNRVLFVAENGTDQAGSGAFRTPFRSLRYALKIAATLPATPTRILLAEGTYDESGEGALALSANLAIAPQPDAEVTLIGAFIGAEGASLTGITLIPPAEKTLEPLLRLDNVRMEIREVVFGGENAQAVTGILLTGRCIPRSLIAHCRFYNINNAIDIGGALPVIRRCNFENLSGSAVIIRDTEDLIVLADGGNLGDAGDPASGFNRFASTIEGPAVINERRQAILMQHNDWDTDVPEEIAVRIQNTAPGGSEVYTPYAAKGSAILANALFCSIFDADSEAPVDTATVALQVSSYRPMTANSNGVYSFPAIPDGSYTIAVTAEGYLAGQQNILLSGGVTKSISLFLRSKTPAEGEGEGEGEGENEGEGEGEPDPGDKGCHCTKQKIAPPAPGDAFTAGLTLLTLYTFSRKRK